MDGLGAVHQYEASLANWLQVLQVLLITNHIE